MTLAAALYSAPPGQDLDLDQDPPIAPGDAPMGVTEFGITPAEERMQESVAMRAAREVPDVDQGAYAAEEADPTEKTGGRP